ncbi:hypothetical protein BG006_006699 [Podila minutissima]|uniref:Uncharacterized protein n=1 Tax=Podila minutissima TaxID=64525 RepID=A0A9P5SLA7_9FUNG|nr:hypothetical protein BG006_006699 [Podila minutissima]
MHRLHPQRKSGVTNSNTTSLRSQTNLPPQTPAPLNNGSHTSSFSFRPNAIMRRPLTDSDLDDFEPLPDVADLFDDPSEGVARQASKRERDGGKIGKTSAGSGSTMALAPTTATTTAKRARVSARTETTAAQTWQELHGETNSGQAHYSFDDSGIDFELDMLSRDDDHHTPVIATKNSPPAQAADRSYSTILNEAVQQVDDILMGGGYDLFDLGNNTRASSAVSQAPTGFHAPLETRGEQQERGKGGSDESLSDTLSGHDKEDEAVKDQAGENARETGTEHPIQSAEDRSTEEATGEVVYDPPAPVYSFTIPASVNELEERLRGLGQLLCSTFDEIIVSVRGVEDLRSFVKEATDVHFRALDLRDGRIQARKMEVQAAATSIQSRGLVDFSSTTL